MLRCVPAVVILTLVATFLVHLRSEATRANYRAHRALLEAKRVERELWHLQMNVAQLRTPALIQRRIEEMKLHVLPPTPQDPVTALMDSPEMADVVRVELDPLIDPMLGGADEDAEAQP